MSLDHYTPRTTADPTTPEKPNPKALPQEKLQQVRTMVRALHGGTPDTHVPPKLWKSWNYDYEQTIATLGRFAVDYAASDLFRHKSILLKIVFRHVQGAKECLSRAAGFHTSPQGEMNLSVAYMHLTDALTQLAKLCKTPDMESTMTAAESLLFADMANQAMSQISSATMRYNTYTR